MLIRAPLHRGQAHTEGSLMSLHIKGERAAAPIKNNVALSHPSAPAKRPTTDPVIERIAPLISTGQYPKAIDALRSAGSNPSVKNALAVCLMRVGQVDEAVKLLRSLTLNPGSTWERPDVPSMYKRNFATALLLAGLPSGCVSVIRSTDEREHPRAIQIEKDIRAWAKTLSFWKRWDWRLNQVDPAGARVCISFVPGEFDFPVDEATSETTVERVASR